MALLTFPHCGRTYVCEDTIGITDIRQARSAYAFALNYGQCQASVFSRSWNPRDASTRNDDTGTDYDVMFDEPIVGFSHRINFIGQSAPYFNRIPLEICDSHDRAAITIGFRFMDTTEAIFLNSFFGGVTSTSGLGANSQRIRITLNNLANTAAINVLDIYYNKTWFDTNVGSPGAVNWIDLTSGTATGGFSASGLQKDGHNVITILQEVTPALRQANRAVAGSLQIGYEFAKNGNGGNWPGGFPAWTPYLLLKDHPLSGAPMAFCGVNEAQVRFYRSDAWTQGTAAATATLSRAYAITPIPSWPAMGDTYTAGVHNSLNAFANSIKGIGYVGGHAIGANRGGFNRPLVGNAYQFTEQIEELTMYGEMPEGATQWMLLAYVRTDNKGGRVQTLAWEASADGVDNITSTTTATGTAARWYYATGSLSAFNQPTNGKVNQCRIVITSSKTIYGARNESQIYWDGVYSYILKFF